MGMGPCCFIGTPEARGSIASTASHYAKVIDVQTHTPTCWHILQRNPRQRPDAANGPRMAEQQSFDIVFRGVTAPGIARETVARNLVQLFGTTSEIVDRLLGGGTHTLKRGLDAHEAERYRDTLARAGALVQLQAASTVDPQSSPDGATSPDTTAQEWTLAPVGSDLLAAHERRQVTATAPDTSHISLAEAGVRLGPVITVEATPPDTSHITLAPQGASPASVPGQHPNTQPGISAPAPGPSG